MRLESRIAVSHKWGIPWAAMSCKSGKAGLDLRYRSVGVAR